MIERIRRMVVKEFIQIFRDPRMKAVVFLMPVVQLLIFGYAVTTDVRHVTLATAGLDRSAAGREVAARFASSGYFDIVARVDGGEDARALVDRGDAQAVLRVEPDFAGVLRAGRTAPVQMIADGTDSNTAGILLDYSRRISGRLAQDVLRDRQARLAGAARRPAGVELRARAWFNENLESRNYYVPGVMAMIVMLVTLLLTGMAVVREKEMGTMEQLLVTPITPAEFILGKTVPFAIVGFADVFLVTGVGVFWFDVPLRGNLLLLLACTALYLMTTLGVGLLISTVSRTQQQAMMSTFFFYLPVVLLSGFMFPIANMPEPVQWLTYLNPFRYFLVIIRGIFLKGVGAEMLWPQMAALAVLGVLTLWLAARRFRKTMA